MQKFCVCVLGNPGEKYRCTRHNIGFQIGHSLCDKYGCEIQKKTKLNAKIANYFISEKKLHIIFPQTFMNLSGIALQKVLHYYQIDIKNTLVVYDDIDLPFGHFRFRERGSAGTHNGMRSIVQKLSTQDIPRLRIGIGKPQFQALDAYVLDDFNTQEKAALPSLLDKALAAISLYFSVSRQQFLAKYPKTIEGDLQNESGSE